MHGGTDGEGGPRPRPSRTALAVAALLIVTGGIAFVELARPSAPDPVMYSSAQSLAWAIHAAGVGCDTAGSSLSSLPGQDIALCSIDRVSTTLTVYEDPDIVDAFGPPTRSPGITWVVGPNWVVATDRTRAVKVQAAIGGRVAPR
jgi:hypothetical protein